jgi:hypothetical protein
MPRLPVPAHFMLRVARWRVMLVCERLEPAKIVGIFIKRRIDAGTGQSKIKNWPRRRVTAARKSRAGRKHLRISCVLAANGHANPAALFGPSRRLSIRPAIRRAAVDATTQ